MMEDMVISLAIVVLFITIIVLMSNCGKSK